MTRTDFLTAMEVLDREARTLGLPLSLHAVLANLALEEAYKTNNLSVDQNSVVTEALDRVQAP